MTKTAPVICIFFIILFFFFFTSQAFAGFADLIKPIPDDNIQQQDASDYQPSITFGDLLNYTETDATDEAQMAQRTARLKKLLAELEENYQTSLEEFKAKESLLPVNDLSLSGTTNSQPLTRNEISPTPYIPISNLVAGVSEIVSNQRSNNFIPTPTLTDKLLLATLNNSVTTQTPRGWQAEAEAQAMTPPMVKGTEQSTIGTLTENPPKSSYSIALLGDSMTDTLGKTLPQLRNLLQSTYPKYFFSFLNYGQGASDLESGLYRLTNSTNYLDTTYPPLLSYKPDILVVESFAYNHWSGEKYDLDRQWLTFAKIIDTVRQKSPDTKIILAASIAPNKDVFGDGILNWPKSLKESSSLIIKAYLQNLVNFATSEHYPLADAYHPSLTSDGNGNLLYINGGDHLHPSNEGAYLYSLKIFETIKSNNLIYNTQ